MNGEPDFMKQISSRTVCDYLYIYFWYTVVVGIIAATSGSYLAMSTKGTIFMKFFAVLPYFMLVVLSILLSMSLYLICERGLKPSAAAEKKQELQTA
jgi:hypothetical protein